MPVELQALAVVLSSFLIKSALLVGTWPIFILRLRGFARAALMYTRISWIRSEAFRQCGVCFIYLARQRSGVICSFTSHQLDWSGSTDCLQKCGSRMQTSSERKQWNRQQTHNKTQSVVIPACAAWLTSLEDMANEEKRTLSCFRRFGTMTHSHIWFLLYFPEYFVVLRYTL